MERRSVCSFESCMQLFRKPGYSGIIPGKQILARIIVNGFACFLFQKEGKERGSACSFTSCMWPSREPGYRGIFAGKQILARMIVNGFAFFLFQKEVNARGSVCRFEFSMQLSREPQYGGLFCASSHNKSVCLPIKLTAIRKEISASVCSFKSAMQLP